MRSSPRIRCSWLKLRQYTISRDSRQRNRRVFHHPVSSIFDIATFVVMWYVFQANAPEHQALFHSGWFVVGLLTQSLIVHMIRTEKVPFVQSIASPPVLVLTATVMAIGVLVPFSALGAAIGLVPLPWSYFPWLAGILACYAALTQFVKVMYIRRFGRWL
jgi:Mg2+-importing ATPase